MRPKLSSIIVLICIVLLPLLTGASPEVLKAIEEYQRVQNTNRRVRIFPFDEGNPSYLGYSFTDSDGYQWFGSYNGKNFSHFRFDGDKFVDMFEGYPDVERDSLLLGSNAQTYDGSIYVAGIHYLYKWQGHAWKRYAFTKNDAIQFVKACGNKVLCIGKTSYCVLTGNSWTSYKAESWLLDGLDKQRFMITGMDEWEPQYFSAVTLLPENQLVVCTIQGEYNLKTLAKRCKDDGEPVFINIGSNGKSDSTIVLSSELKKQQIADVNLIEPQFHHGTGSDMWLYLRHTPYFYYFDSKTRSFKPSWYPEGTEISGIMRFKEPLTTNWKTKTLSIRELIIYTQNGKVVAESLGPVDTEGRFRIEGTLPDAVPGMKYQFIISIDDTAYSSSYAQYPPDKQVQIAYHYDSKQNKLIMRDLSSLRSNVHNKLSFPELGLTNSKTFVYNKRSITEGNIPGIHAFNALGLKDNERYDFSITDPGKRSEFSYLDPVAKTALITTQYSHYLVPLAKPVKPLNAFDISQYSELETHRWPQNSFISSGMYSQFLLRSRYIRPGQEADIHNIDGQSVTPLVREKWLEWSHNGANSFILVGRVEGSRKHIFEWNLNSNRKLPITSTDKNTRIIQSTDGAGVILINDQDLGFQLWHKADPNSDFKLTSSGSFDAAAKVLDTKLKSDQGWGYKILSFLKNGQTILLSDGKLACLPPLDLTMASDSSISYGERYYPSLDPKDRPREFTASKNNNEVSFNVVPFIFNPVSGDLEFKPDWLGIKQFGTRTLVSYYEKDDKNQYYYHSSVLSGWKADKSPNDFRILCANGKDPVRQRLADGDYVLYETNDGKLYYCTQNGWNYLDIKGYTGDYGPLREVISVSPMMTRSSHQISTLQPSTIARSTGPAMYADDAVLALRFERGIVKYPLSGEVVSVITNTDGIEFNNRTSMVFDWQHQRLLVADDYGIYEISSPSSSAKLHIPWLENNGNRIPRSDFIRIKYKQRDLRIPINILQSPDPRRFQIKYQLIGYDKEARLREWSPYLEYNRLPAGKYTLSVIAYSPDGVPTDELKVPIRVLPPLWDTWWARLIYAIAIFFSLRAIMRWRLKRLERRNKMLEQAVSERTIELSEKQRRMTESIQYASLIQRSILPQTAQLNELFSSHFVIWKPRDIVGGDFYWLHHKPETQRWLFAVIDCTGHGVPGALITMTVNSILNHLVTDQGIEAPVTLLKELHSQLGAALHQEEDRTQQDGLEISMIAVDKSKSELEFAGAGLHLIHWHPELEGPELIRGYKHGLGGLKRYKQLDLSSSVVSYRQDSIFYMYTDGIIDQPRTNDERRIRFGHPQWLEFINRVAVYDLMRQQERFEGKLESLLEIHEQRDDITVVGMRM